MKRIIEPELMNETDQVEAYANADFSISDQEFVNYFLDHAPLDQMKQIADLGCGPGNITYRLAKALPQVHLVGIDGAHHMLKKAKQSCSLMNPSIQKQIQWLELTLPFSYPFTTSFDAVVANSFLHHLHQPQVLWETLFQIARSGAYVLVGDLYRPPDQQAVSQLVDIYSADAPTILKEDFFASLCAAFEPHEIKAQLIELGLTEWQVQVVSDRHMLISGLIP